MIFGRGGYLVLVVELVVIVGFVAFWYMQTRELWFYPTREQKSVDVGPGRSALGRLHHAYAVRASTPHERRLGPRRVGRPERGHDARRVGRRGSPESL